MLGYDPEIGMGEEPVDVGNPASNVIPATAQASFNIRFNDCHDSAALIRWMRGIFDDVGGSYELDVRVTGESFLTPPGTVSDALAQAVQQTLGRTPELSTTGGTSDARFIKDYCPVAEFGLVSQTMHKVDERCSLDDIRTLTDIYETILSRFFQRR